MNSFSPFSAFFFFLLLWKRRLGWGDGGVVVWKKRNYKREVVEQHSQIDLSALTLECVPLNRLIVTATDRGSPRLAGTAFLTVIIVDLNDNSPTIPLPLEVRVPESE